MLREGDPGAHFYIILHGSCAVIAIKTKSSGMQKFSLLSVLRQGDSFGELALISDQPRAASVLCREQCYFAVLERNDYKTILKEVQERQMRGKMKALEQHSILGRLGSHDLKHLSAFCQIRTYHWKQSLFYTGQRLSDIFMVLEGKFIASKGLPEGEQTRVKGRELGTLKPGEVIGVRSALESLSVEYTCTCVSALGLVICISCKNLRRIVHNQTVLTALVELDYSRESAFGRPGKRELNRSKDQIQVRPALARSQTMLEPPKIVPHRASIIDKFLSVTSNHMQKKVRKIGGNGDGHSLAELRVRTKVHGRNASMPDVSTTLPV